MLRSVLRLLLGFVLLLLVAAGAAFLYVDQIAKAGIERGATYALGVETTVDEVRLRPRSGEFALGGLDVTNPGGFDSPYFLRVAGARLHLPLQRLLDDTIRVPRIVIADVDLTLLRTKRGSNYDAILQNLKRFESDGSADSGAKNGAKEFIIDELLITDVSAKVSVGILGEASVIDVMVPEIRLSDIGSKSGGVTTAQLTGIITKAILAAVIRTGGIPLDLAKDLKGQLAGLAGVKLQLPAGLEETAGRLLGGDVKGDIGQVLNGLLGGKKSP